MGRAKIITKAKFIKSSEKSFGNIEVMRNMMRCSREAIYKFMGKNPEMKDILETDRNRMIDVAENKLYTLINEKDASCIKWYLSRMAKDRGYGDQLEIDQTVNGHIDNKIQIEILKPKISEDED